MREVDWLSGDRRYPGELRLPGIACIIRVAACIERGGATHTETRYYVFSANLDAERAGQAVRGHWAIENSLHWVLDVTFGEDDSRVRDRTAAHSLVLLHKIALSIIDREGNQSQHAGSAQKGRLERRLPCSSFWLDSRRARCAADTKSHG